MLTHYPLSNTEETGSFALLGQCLPYDDDDIFYHFDGLARNRYCNKPEVDEAFLGCVVVLIFCAAFIICRGDETGKEMLVLCTLSTSRKATPCCI